MSFFPHEYEPSKKPSPKVNENYNKGYNPRVKSPNYTTAAHNNSTYKTYNTDYETKTPSHKTNVSNDFSYYNMRKDSLLSEDKRTVSNNKIHQYNEPVPVPMMPLYGYDNYEDSEKDWGYFRQLYPSTASRILKEVDQECDQLEYNGSFMFDEYPDKVRLRQIIDRLYDKLQNEIDEPAVSSSNVSPSKVYDEVNEEEDDFKKLSKDVESNQYRQDNRRPPTRNRNWLRDLIEILLFQELQNRRRRYRSRRRWF